MNKKVSIVICTYNRAAFLNRTLKSLSKLAYRDFEVIVINGPSTDNTSEILEKYKNSIKIANNDKANLSISRNMGIALSSGDIVAFIDDDAIPDKYWLNDIVSLYTDESIGGVGGKVYGPGDNHFQFENGYVDIWGYADVRNYGPDYNEPNGDKFNMMLGTNATFLKKALIEIGGFDEYYDYYHDESDACVRIVQAGYKIFNHERAFIHHEYAKSHIRENTFDGCRLNWYPIVKNKAYFAIKNSINKASDEERETRVIGIKKEHLDFYKKWFKEKRITKEEYNKFISLCKNGFEKGFHDGYHNERLLNFDIDKKTEFKKYDPKLNEQIISVCLLCKDDIISSIGGVAKYTYEIAKGLVKKGHIVHVITAGDDKENWVNTWGQEGINFHKVTNFEQCLDLPEMNLYQTSYNNLKYSYAVHKKVQEINEKYIIDILESPLWNFEGCVSAKMLKGILPVLVRLQTPLLKVAETQNWNVTDDLKLFSDFEREMILNAEGIISISDNITHTISDLYDIDINKLNNSKVYLGVDEPKQKVNRRVDEKISVLFVGRLERRKGIHTIFESIPKVMENNPNVEFRFVGNDEVVDETLKSTYKQYFDKKYAGKRWANNVIFLGQVSNEEKEKEFADCDIFIAPSLYESFGIILIEAMSAKKPVIGCKIGGMQEIVKENYNGFLIDVENSQQLVDRLETLINDNEKRLEFGENGYRRYKEFFSNESLINKTLEVYSKFVLK